MKIATFNIWNSNEGMPYRKKQIIDEISSLNADIICLQEVKDEKYNNELALACGYKYYFFNNYIGEEGLSIFSMYPIVNKKELPYAISATITYNNITMLVTNLHLSWDSTILREKQIVDIIRSCDNTMTDYAFILGDFNCSENSSIHNFLLGQQSLIEHEANPYWYDLASAYSDRISEKAEFTLDFRDNPRWKGKNTIETNQRFDRILLKNTYPKEFPFLNNCYVFGKKVSNKSGYCASDHYGVVIDIDFKIED